MNLIQKIYHQLKKFNWDIIVSTILDHDQEQMPKAINKRMPDGRSVPTKFEDMYPFKNTRNSKNML